MSDDQSPRLSLPFILPAQAQKHVTHNESIDLLDTLVQMVVEGFAATTPPPAPAEGEVWALGAAPLTLWAGQAQKLAVWRGGLWRFVQPAEGWRAWGRADGALRVFRDEAWMAALQDVAGIGVNTVHDLTNRLAVAAPASLFTHDGAGHQVKVNKATVSDTASLLFQTNWSGRAEMGLAGDDQFRLKVSADGATFAEALAVDPATGTTRVKCLTSQRVTLADGGVASITPPGAGGFVLVTVVHATQPLSGHSGIFVHDCGPTPACLTLLAGPEMENLGTTLPTGTSGTAGRSAIAATAGQLKLQNRSGAVADYSLTFIGGL